MSEVQAAHGWVAPFERLRHGLRLGGLALAAGIGLGALAAATGAAAAARRANADEVTILRLAGVPALRLAAPLVLQALGLATLGSLLGLAGLSSRPSPARRGSGPGSGPRWDSTPCRCSRPPGSAGLAGGGAALGVAGALAAGRP